MSEDQLPGGAAPQPPPTGEPRKPKLWQQLLPWVIALACFSYLYTKLAGGAARAGMSVPGYLAQTFADVNWANWLMLMIPYSALFFLIDTLVIWRVINWFNTRVSYTDMLPIRGSSYILSILNEQVGKGAMGLYLYRRHGVPGWEVGSSMLFVMLCEFLYLSAWASVGYAIAGDALPEIFRFVPLIFVVVAIAIAVFHTISTRGAEAEANPPSSDDEERGGFFEQPIFHSFRNARWWYYPTIIALRSPALLAAVVVYTWVLRLFDIDIGMTTMLGYLPVIFFGAATPGPMRSVAITLWVFLFPEQDPAKMTAFGFVQHNFFIFFNAAIGMLFLRRANRELFDSPEVATSEAS